MKKAEIALREYNNVAILGCRQCHKTTDLCRSVLDHAVNSENKYALLCVNTHHQATRVTDILRNMASVVQGIRCVRSARDTIEFSNGSRISVRTLNSNSVRGVNPSMIAIDDINFFPDREIDELSPIFANKPRIVITGLDNEDAIIQRVRTWSLIDCIIKIKSTDAFCPDALKALKDNMSDVAFQREFPE